MFPRSLVLGSLAAVATLACTVQGGVIAAWDFQTTTNGGTAAATSPATPKVYVSNFGSGTMYLDGTNGSGNFFVPASGTTNTELNAFGGTTVNADTSIGMSTVTTGAAALAVLGGLGQAANGKSIVFAFSMSGYQDLTISYATQRTSTGFTTQLLEYSTDGISWSLIGSNTAIQSSFSATSTPAGVATVFSGISGLDGAATAFVRMTLTGATSSSGNNRFDNIVLSAQLIPAPGAVALLCVAGALGARRRR